MTLLTLLKPVSVAAPSTGVAATLTVGAPWSVTVTVSKKS